MPKLMEIFGMTFAKKWTYGAPEICQNGNESTFQQNIGHSDILRHSTNIAKSYNINDIYHITSMTYEHHRST
jgi:hypothetical protein